MTLQKKMKIHRNKKKTSISRTVSQSQKKKSKIQIIGKGAHNSDKADASIAKKDLSVSDLNPMKMKNNKSVEKETDTVANCLNSSKSNLNCDKESKTVEKNPIIKKKKKLKSNNKHRLRESADLKSRTPKMCSKSKDSIPDKLTTSESSKKRTPLTVRQLHKRKKLAEKRKAQREMKKKKKIVNDEKKGKIDSNSESCKKSTEGSPTSERKPERIILPKNVVEATSNWRKLQMTMKNNPDRKSHKRKVDQTLLRNPKYRKIDEKTISERIIFEVNKPKKEKKSQEIWFDDVDELLVDDQLDENTGKGDKPGRKVVNEDDTKLVKPEAFKGLTKLVGMDCEMVGVRNNQSVIARVSIVNRYGEQLYDKFVKPTDKVTDYRTSISGIRPEDLEKGEPFNKVRKEVADILKGRTLIGHALKNDLQVLRLHHPKADIRDTSTFEPFRKLFGNKTPGLRKLTGKVLSVKIQQGEHSSVQDAQAAVRLYMLYKTQWEAELKNTVKKRKKKKKMVKTVLDKVNEDQLEKIDRLWDV